LGSRALCQGDLFTAHTYLTEAVQRRIALRDEVGAAVSQHNLNLLLTSPDQAASQAAVNSATETVNLSPVTQVQPQTTQFGVPPSASASASVNGIQPGANTVADDSVELVSQEEEAIAASASAFPSEDETALPSSSTSSTDLAYRPESPLQPASDAPSSYRLSQDTESRSFPIGWIVVAGIAALFGGLGAYLALTWNRAPFSVSPGTLEFTPQLLNVESDIRQFTLTNTGSENLEIASIAFSEGDRRDFSIANQTCTQESLRPKEDCTVGISFTPEESGGRSARLRIADRSGEHVRQMQVRGIGEAAQISFDSDGLAFDPILAGSDQTPTQSITLTNDSAVTFSLDQAFISGERTDSFAIARDACASQSLDPGDTCTVDVAFTPPGGGVFEANFSIRDTTGEYTWLSPLIGTGQLSAPSISPAGLPFGTEVIGRLATNVVTITNTGASPLEISEISITGDTSNFSLRGNTCTRNPVGPGESCSVTIGFSPRSARNYAANLVISDNAINSPRSIQLTGRGRQPSPVAAPALTPNALMFGEQEVGTTQQESLTLTNRANQSIQVRSVSMAETTDFSIVNDSCTNTSLAPGSSCTVTVGFNPRGTGDRSTSLTIQDTAAGSPRTVAVTGTGTTVPDPQILSIEVTPDEIAPGERSRICYRVANVERLFLRNSQTGEETALSPTSGCATVTPSQTTSYTLVAEGRSGQTVTQRVGVQVSDPDTTPPPVPAPIAPAGNEYVLCPSTPRVNLDWNPVADDSEPITYTTVLQRGSSAIEPQDTTQSWTAVTEQTTSATEFDITPYLERGRISYRWRVSAQDAAGNASGSSGWLYFRTCE